MARACHDMRRFAVSQGAALTTSETVLEGSALSQTRGGSSHWARLTLSACKLSRARPLARQLTKDNQKTFKVCTRESFSWPAKCACARVSADTQACLCMSSDRCASMLAQELWQPSKCVFACVSAGARVYST
eukprot:1157433-Pelagomonas_calceolata.AAC.15